MERNFLQFLFLVILFISPSLSQNNLDSEAANAVDNLIVNHFLPLANITSLGLTIVQNDGQILYSKGYGWADRERALPMQNTTQFLVGSITKSLTSLVVAKVLHEKFPQLGELVLDIPIRILIPQANFTLSDRIRSEQTTFRDLVAHRECLYQGNLPIVSGSLSSAREAAYASRYEEQFCGFRNEFQYNNRMYILAGELIGILADSTFDNLVRNLLNELGMRGSALGTIYDNYSHMPYRAKPYYVRGSEINPMNTNLIKRLVIANAAGGMFASPNDMARYMRLHLNLGRLDGRQIIPQQVMQWLRRPSAVFPTIGYRRQYTDRVISVQASALGLMLASYDGWEYVGHGGYYAPYSSQMSLYPAKNLAIFSSTNMGASRVDQGLLHAVLFDAFTGAGSRAAERIQTQRLKVEDRKAKKEKEEKEFEKILEKVKGKGRSRGQSEIIGKYGSGSLGDAEISEQYNPVTNQRQLFFQHGPWYQGWLEGVLAGHPLYRLHLVTDAVQDDYAAGVWESAKFVYVLDGILYFNHLGAGTEAISKFKFGLRREQLPATPWSSDSCSPAYA